MEKIKHLLVTFVVISAIVTGVLAIAVVLDLASTEAAKETFVKVTQVFGIVTIVCGVVIGVLQINKSN